MTEEEVQKWLNKNTEYCEIKKSRQKIETCKKRIEAMETRTGFYLDLGCKQCTKFASD